MFIASNVRGVRNSLLFIQEEKRIPVRRDMHLMALLVNLDQFGRESGHFLVLRKTRNVFTGY